MRERASQTLRSRILLEAVASEAELEVSAEELEAAIVALSAQSEQDAEEVKAALVESGQIEALAGDILRRKALDLVLSEATAVDDDGNPVDLTPPASDADEADDNEADVPVATADETDESPKTDQNEAAADAGSGTEQSS
jgi:trigger factor